MKSKINKDLIIAAKTFGTKYSPYFLNKRKELTEDIAELIKDLKPYQTQFDLIRVGGEGDGGYILPDDIRGIECCFSPGVSNLVTFEEDLSKKFGITSMLCDYAVDKPNANFDFNFEKKFVGAHNDEIFMTLDAWHEKYFNKSHNKEFLLQMDIEGAEYQSLLNVSGELLRRFRIIAIELHHLFKLLDYVTFPIMRSFFKRLLESHTVVHMHPNNNQGTVKIGNLEIPDVMEITFLRNDRIEEKSPATVFPHPLDTEVDPERRPLPLPACWYK